MFSIDPSTLSDTRNQLHWASQLLSAEADAKLEKAADDSHPNVGWDAGTSSLVGRGGSSINVPEFEIIDPAGQHYSLTGKTLADARDWLSGQRKAELKLRDYELPEHAVAKGSGF